MVNRSDLNRRTNQLYCYKQIKKKDKILTICIDAVQKYEQSDFERKQKYIITIIIK